MNEELELEKLNDLAIHYPVYLIDAAAEHFNGDECKLEAISSSKKKRNMLKRTARKSMRICNG